ncbi:thymidylate synthase [Alkalihalobacillus sp. NPDC078783]
MDKVFKSNRCGYAKVIDVLPSNTVYEKTVAIRLQFIDTGYITTIQKNDLLRGRFVDRFARTVCNVGYLGAYENVKSFNEEELKYFRGTWNSMISRCYNPNNKNYDRYGGKGIFVDERWHCFEYYLSDISSLPQFHLAKNEKYKNWAIDKDYYISNYYSNSSCVWLPYSENTIYNSNHSPFYVISKDGDKELFIEQKKACQKYNFDNSNLSKAIRFNKTLKGFRFETVSDGNTYRYELSRNQVTELIYNIKHSPASRRLMTSFWNYADVNKKQLQECVWSTQWHVKAGKLHLEVLCRSNDVFLGNPFNVFQYNVLQRMIAQVTGYELGEYIFHIGDTHVYDRHIDIIKQQIESTMYDAPQLWINPNITDFYKFTADDFKLIDYKHGETLRMEVAI